MLADIPNMSIKNLFWRPNVVDAIAYGTPTQSQCDEFHSSSIDGASGGYGACNMAENVGHAMQQLLDSEGTLCHMKNFPTVANFKSGSVTIQKGVLPQKDITKLFMEGGKQRIIKVSKDAVSSGEIAEEVFIKIHSISQNSAKG